MRKEALQLGLRGEGLLWSWLYQFEVGFLAYELVGKGGREWVQTPQTLCSYQIIIGFLE